LLYIKVFIKILEGHISMIMFDETYVGRSDKAPRCHRERWKGLTMATRVLVTGAGGFIGHHLVKYLVSEGYWVRGVDLKHREYEPSPAHEFELLDLRRFDNCLIATRGIEEVYHLAADMGGTSATSPPSTPRSPATAP
jgi:hypothetical protein